METISRVQKIGGGGTAFSFIEEPVELPLLASHGGLYVVIDYLGDNNPEHNLICRMLWDTLRESYFSLVGKTPMQALEKALADVSERMLGMSLNPTSQAAISLPSEINISAVVKWGNYLYTALSGGGKVFIVRKGLGVSEMVSDPALAATLTAQTLEDGDVALVTSKSLGSSLTGENLLKHLGGLEQEVAGAGSKLALVIRNSASVVESTPVSRSGLWLKKVRGSVATMIKNSPSSSMERRSRLLGIAAVVLGITLVGSLLISSKDPHKLVTKTQVLGEDTALVAEMLKEASDNLDINPLKTKEALVAASAALAKLSPEDGRGKTARELQEQLSNLQTAVYKIQTLTSFKEASMPATIYFAKEKLAATSLSPDQVVASTLYSTLWYGLVPAQSQVYKAVTQGDGSVITTKRLSGGSDLSSSLDLAVDGDIWVLTPQTILRFYDGLPKDFTLSGHDRPFNNPQALYTDENSDYLYVYDAGNNRLVVFNKLGSYQFQVLFPAQADGIYRLAVDEEAQTFTLVSGSKAIAGTWQ